MTDDPIVENKAELEAEPEAELEAELGVELEVHPEGTAADSEPVGPPEAETLRALEAILMVADQPSDPSLLSQLLEVSPMVVNELCAQLAGEYEASGRGFQLVQVAGGWRFQSHPDMAEYVEKFALDGQVARLSGAALETLAIVAYKQPISRAQIAQIRGVSVDGVMRTLVQRGFVAEIGTDPGPGQATLFGTTNAFLTGIGINSVADLAPLADFVPGSEIMEALEAGLRVDHSEPLAVQLSDLRPTATTATTSTTATTATE